MPAREQKLALESPISCLPSPLDELRYPGSDSVGALWSRPPAEHVNVRDVLPAERRPVVCVLGSSGFKGSWQAGIAAALQDIAKPVRWDLASGGTIPGLAAAAGISRQWQRLMNAGAPSHEVLQPAPGLRWFERRNLDLAGVYQLDAVESWLGAWLAWAGVHTFRDLRYAPEEPHPAKTAYRAGISVIMWRSRKPWPHKCTLAQLQDPTFVRRVFRWAFFGLQFPFKQFRQVWVPDTISEHLPWLADEIDDHSPAWWARISMSQWPACLPTVLQDPATHQLIFLTDGGHIDNQPSFFNDGRPHDVPILNPRLQQNPRQGSEKQRVRDTRRFPLGKVVRFPVTSETKWTALQGHDLTWADRDAMWRRGLQQGASQLPQELSDLFTNYPKMLSLIEAAGGRIKPQIPALHGFQTIAAARRPWTRNVFALRS